MANVMLVDDHVDLREVLAELLGRHGHHVRVCVSGEMALRGLDQEPPDAVIADQRLPGISGVELLRMIRRHPRLARIPVIICSADDTPRGEAHLAGATDFWLKGSDRLFDDVERLGELLQSR
jgi:CheY-like chemotaxis protein